MILVPQPEDRLNGVIIFDAQNNPIEGLSTKEEAFFRNISHLWSVDVARGGGGLPASVARVLTVRCDRFHDGDSVVDWRWQFRSIGQVQCVAGGCADFRTLVGDV